MDRKKTFITLSAVALGSVLYNYLRTVKSNVEVVQNFELEKYLGKWYEIARIDFFWEKNLKNVTAEYSLNEDGTVKVKNQGVTIKSNKTKTSIGKAKFIRESNEGALKVSFFGPVYSGYQIVQLDPSYQDALIFGDNLDYLWILSRSKSINPERKARYLKYAEEYGYDLSTLTWTIQDEN